MPQHDSALPRHDPAKLHPAIYRTLIGLVLWMLLSVWLFFDTARYSPLLLSVVTFFFTFLIAIPTALWLSWRRAGGNRDGEKETLREWFAGRFETKTGSIRSSEAATQILLPIGAVCIGMTLFGMVLWFTLPGLYMQAS